MGWFADTLKTIKDAAGHDPVECPRGWGKVSFVGSFWFVPPFGGVSRACPIGGVEQCGECKYASNPDAFRLADQLAELERLHGDGKISTEEHATRRAAVVHLHVRPPGRGLEIAAWIVGPLGALLAGVGPVLALQFHPGFWGLAGAGAALLVLGFSFWVLARSARARAASDV
jgi:hypothetical protein